MRYIYISAFIFSFFIANGKGKKYPAAFYEEREEIFEKTDTVISYVRASSGSVEHTEQSGYLIYKLNGIYQMHYCCWDNTDGKIIQEFKTKDKGKEIRAIFSFVINNYNVLKSFNGSNVFDSIDNLDRKNKGLAERFEKKRFDHYAFIDYKVKINSMSLYSRLDVIPELMYYVQNAPMLGYFLVIMNTLYYRNNFDWFLDIPH